MIVYSIYIALFSAVFVILLTQPGMIFGWYKDLINKIKSDYIRKPLGDCELCVAGQIALWSYLFMWDGWLHWIIFIVLTIFFTHIITWIITKTTI